MSDYEALTIATGDGASELELVPAYGGICNRLVFALKNGKTINVMDGLTNKKELQRNKYYRGIVLYPYVNRLDAGRFNFGGRSLQFEINEPELNNSLHGFLMDLVPRVTGLRENKHDAEVTLQYEYDGHIPAYPFPAGINVTYHLDASEGLGVTIKVKNMHKETVPVGTGWHPYFTLGKKVDGLKLKLPEVRRIEVNNRMLPTGDTSVFRDFSSLNLIGDRKLDDCMQIDECGDDTVTTQLYSEESGFGLEIWQIVSRNIQESAGYPYVQVFIPPDRGSIAIEPVSCGINAFNTGENLVYLEKDSEVSFHCGVRLI